MMQMDKFLSIALKLYIISAGTNYAITEGTTFPPPITNAAAEWTHEMDHIVEVTNGQWNKVNEASTLEDLHKILGIQPENEVQSGIVPFRESTLRSASPDRYLANPDLTVCTPELISVDMSLPDIPGVVHFPKCIKVQRCGGCCVNTARICKPTYSRKLIVKVMKLTTMNLGRNSNLSRRRRRNRGNSRRERDTDSVMHESLNVTVTEHTKCDCQCRVTAADCNLSLQEYNEHMCSCNCKNRDKREKCSNDNLRYWSEETCACKCREGHFAKCSTGKVFDPNTCKCERSEWIIAGSSFDHFLRRAEYQLKEDWTRFNQSLRNRSP